MKPFKSYGTLKSGASHIWTNELNRSIEWFLHANSDSIIFDLTTNLLCIFIICWVSTAVVPVKNNVLLLAHRKSLRTCFFQMLFNKSLIKCEKIVSWLMQYSKKYGKWPETWVLILHIYWTQQFQNFAVPLIWLSHSTT